MNWAHSCKRVAELLTQRMDQPLGWLDSFRLRMHLSMCSNCSHVEQQLLAVEAATAEFFSVEDEPPGDAGPVDEPGIAPAAPDR